MAEAVAAAGVDKLISRLREDGVKAGQDESARLIREAESRAARIVADAQKEADEMRAAAKEEIKARDQAAQGALRMAARDTTLALRNQVRETFEKYVRQLVVESTQDPEFIRSLILVLAGEAVEKHIRDKEAAIYLSKAVFEGEKTPEGRRRGGQFVKGLSSGLLRQGITLVPSEQIEGGAKVQLVRDQLEIDLSDHAITELLIRHITPRFREIMSGGE
jgi:V/A-type H+-transporting ATPase subunit E